jgi:hypothetical protein
MPADLEPVHHLPRHLEHGPEFLRQETGKPRAGGNQQAIGFERLAVAAVDFNTAW